MPRNRLACKCSPQLREVKILGKSVQLLVNFWKLIILYTDCVSDTSISLFGSEIHIFEYFLFHKERVRMLYTMYIFSFLPVWATQ